MTRGYVVIADGDNILSAMYSNSDSYLSGLGIEVLDAIKTKTLDKYIEEYNKEYTCYADDIDGITMSWINKKKGGEGFYVDYAYLYDCKKRTLSVYNYGDFAFKLSEKDFEVAEFVFNHDCELYYKWAFNKSKLEYERDSYKTFRAMLKKNATLKEYQDLLDSKVDSFYVESGRMLEYMGSQNYYKVITDVDSGDQLKFYVKPYTFYGEKREVYLETILGRIYVHTSSTPNGADMAVKKLAKNEREALFNLMTLLGYINEYQEKLDNYMFIKRNYEKASTSSQKQLEETLEQIQKFREENVVFKNSTKTLNQKSFEDYLKKLRTKMLHSEDEVEEKK